MEYKLKVYDIYEFGQRVDKAGNPHQEDSIYPRFEQSTEADRLFILCDGMGGHDAGEVASATVCEEMSRSVNDALRRGERFSRDTFDAALDAAFRGLDAKDVNPESKKKMGTTMTFLMLEPSGAFIAHMGDSRVYHIRPGKDGASTEILKKTYDHSLVNDLVRIGELTPEEARTSPRRNVITRALQPHLDRRPKADVYFTADVKPGDYFYMCSDGMLEQMEDDRLSEIFSAAGGDDLTKKATLLKETENNQDNHTAFIVHILDVIGAPEPTQQPAAAPASPARQEPSAFAPAPSAAQVPPPFEPAMHAAVQPEIIHEVEAEPVSAPAPTHNAPLTARMADKIAKRARRIKWLLLLLAALVAIAAVLLIFAMRD